METWQVIVLALVQGLTEFLPISSSAHLIFPSQLLGWQDQGLAFDVAVHLGTLLAVVFYLRAEITFLWQGCFECVRSQRMNDATHIGVGLLLATLPAGLAGLWLDDYVETHLRSILVIACTTLLFGLLLAWADYKPRLETVLEKIRLPKMILIGASQMFALIPGTSRSGITMTVALMLGLTRESAARFSFLLSIPLIGAIGAYKTVQLLQSDTVVNWTVLSLGFVLSAISAFFCIQWFVGFVNRVGFLPFVIYRLLLSAALFYLYFTVL